jgi:cell division protein FtsB
MPLRAIFSRLIINTNRYLCVIIVFFCLSCAVYNSLFANDGLLQLFKKKAILKTAQQQKDELQRKVKQIEHILNEINNGNADILNELYRSVLGYKSEREIRFFLMQKND